jgi:hypothetical protein
VRDTCSLTVLGIDVTERVMTAAQGQIGGRMRTLDGLVAGVDLRSKIEGVWRTLREPISLADGVWLFLDPREIYLRSLQGLGLTLQAEVGLLAFPRVVLGQRPVADSIALPDLQRTDLPSGLRILIEGEADYDASAALLTRELGGRTLDLGGRDFVIRRLGLSGIGDGRLALEVTFEGAASGTIYLVGTPAFDPSSNTIHVPDLDFDVATRNLLVAGSAWIARDELVTYLRARARVPAADAMNLAREQLESGLNRALSDEVRISGQVIEARVLGVRARRSSLVVQSQAEAVASLYIDTGG